MKEEPSVLDYVKARLRFRKGPALSIPAPEPAATEGAGLEPAEEQAAVPTAQDIPAAKKLAAAWPWRSILAALLALAAQFTLEPRPNPNRWQTGLVLYIFSAGLLAWSTWRGEWKAAEIPSSEHRPDPLTSRLPFLLASLPLIAISFLAFSGNQFTSLNLILWAISLALVIQAFWLGQPGQFSWFWKVVDWFRRPQWSIQLSHQALLWLAVLGVAVFVRAYQMVQVPPEMNSDHAEKLLDVMDVLNGQTHIFFPRNTGREAFQFYLIALTIKLLGTGVSFTSMKIGTILAGVLTLTLIYTLGKEVANRQAGLLAMAFAGIAYWPNVISRVGLRFPLYPLFVALTLYFLFRGLRTANRNDYLLSGLFLGIGLHTYTPIRILPLVVLAAVALFLLHKQSQGVRKQTLLGLATLIMVAFVVFLPLLRYAQQNPTLFAYRTFTRLENWEQPLPAPAWKVFLHNLWNALLMFGWNDGQIWVVSVTNRPALDVVSAAFFYSGMLLLFIRYLRRRHWLDLFLILSVPLLMLPSILSLAFPAENPAPNRAGGALVPVFLIVGLCLEGFTGSLLARLKTVPAKRLAWAGVLLLFGLSALQNYYLVFQQYEQSYISAAWNSSEMGEAIHNFATTMGSYDSAWVVTVPYGVDTRLVGIQAEQPTRDYAIPPDQLRTTQADPRAKMFIVNLKDTGSLDLLHQLYPQGWTQTYPSKYPDKDFWMFFVPPATSLPAETNSPSQTIPLPSSPQP